MLEPASPAKKGDMELTVLEASAPTRVVLFAAGRGGDPRRHHRLLQAMADAGCTVLAPHFEMMSPTPTPADMQARASRLASVLHSRRGSVPLVGVGHSVGAALLLGLAGARLWTSSGEVPAQDLEPRFERLVLLAPASDFVRSPGALDAVTLPLLILAGGRDRVVPPGQLAHLAERLPRPQGARVEVVEGADHFSFMDARPPSYPAPATDTSSVAEDIRRRVLAFATA